MNPESVPRSDLLGPASEGPKLGVRVWQHWRSLLPWLSWLAVSAQLLHRAAGYWVFTLDDAFITLRYSKHLAAGLGPTWNPGPERAEGYTTVSWMLILTVAEALGLDGPDFAKVAAVVCGIAVLGASAYLCTLACAAAQLHRSSSMLGALATLALSAAYWPLSLHAVSGMETTFSALVLTVFFALSAATQRAGSERHAARLERTLAVAALVAVLTRPEAALLCGATLATQLALLSSDARTRFARAISLWLLLPGVLYSAWRWSYFGLLFPLSFYVKATGQPLFAGLADVLEFFAPFVSEQPWWGLLFVVGSVRARTLMPGLIGALCFVGFFVFPEHIMAFEGRYLLPLFPLIAALCGVGLAATFERARSLLRGRPAAERVAEAITAVGMVALACVPMPGRSAQRAQRWLDYGAHLQRAHVALARDLARGTNQRGRIALLDVGAIGYYADWYTIDTFGLNNAHIAITRRTDIDYVFAQRPDLLILVSGERGRYAEVFAWETPLYEAARRRGFTRACDYQFDRDYQLQVYSRPGYGLGQHGVCSSSLAESKRAVPRASEY